jgi:hypothetical protein
MPSVLPWPKGTVVFLAVQRCGNCSSSMAGSSRIGGLPAEADTGFSLVPRLHFSPNWL